ncbi:SPFH domain-containing protein [Vineibacter terrae]|uniref:SPFH domain-containing protein n=1 Tax=Vineibacter terrae TaxID=2586908 RepID=A0A5C8PFT7_9HYPH|nr:SPFH domain-containing protein [Vineibacter terrae]TXL72164.1 SPFH domain-containing protein [Vineibacter terrae]
MFGVRFLKTQPTQYVIRYRNGQRVSAGTGLSFFYFAPATSLVVVPTASGDSPFIFEETTADWQMVSIQGQLTWRIAQPERIAELMDFTLNAAGRYASEDPQKLPQRLLDRLQASLKTEIRALPLGQALAVGDALAARVGGSLGADPVVTALGLEILGFSILAIKPKPETARALEAEAREALLKRADEAIYARRNAAVEQERAIKENELRTEIAVQVKRQEIAEADMVGRITLEEKNARLVELATANARQEAEAKAHGIEALMRAAASVDPRVLEALATSGMRPEQTIAAAFRDLAGNAGKIGQLNVSPDLLGELLSRPQPA